ESLLFVLRTALEEDADSPRDLCMAGGVALNCTANGVIARSGLVDRIFVQPAAGDDGSALGAALWQLRQHVPGTPVAMSMPYWGEEIGEEDIAQARSEERRVGIEC